jgi:protease-4
MKIRIPWVVWLIVGFARNGLNGQSAFLSYDEIRSFTPAVPCAWDNSLSAFANPAAVNFIHGPELIVMRSDYTASLSGDWGLFSGAGPVGFGIVSKHLPPGVALCSGITGVGSTVRDYRLSFGGGSKGLGFGLGWGWSGGDAKQLGRRDVFLAGLIARPSRFLSIGLSGAAAGQKEGVADLAVRPLGSERLTLFADAALWSKDKLRDARWSAGAAVEPFPGLKIAGKWSKNKTLSLGAAFSLGGLSVGTTGNLKNGKKRSALHSFIRIGAPERNIVDEVVLKDKCYLSLDLSGRIAYRKYRFFDAKTITLSGLLDALQGAADDPRIKGVAVNFSGTSFASELSSLAKSSEIAWEVHEALLKLRRAGKRVVAFIDESGMNDYYVASAADKVVLDPEGMMVLEGYAVGKTYLKGLLDKIGIGVEEFRYFKYKSASEVLARKEMSDADREQLQAYIDDCYGLVRKEIAAARRFSEAKFDSLVDGKLVFLPEDALREGLADTLGRWSDAEKLIEKMEGAKKLFIGPGRLAKNAFPPDHWGADPGIAVVYALGPCDLETGIQARKLEKIIHGLEKDGSVRAVVLRADSPGGSGLASDLVAEAVKSCRKKKPVIVSQGDVAASGGYWISMYGNAIVAGPSTITGSIGVIGAWIWNNGLGDKIGLRTDVVQAGKHADLLQGMALPYTGLRIPNRDMTADEKARVESMIRGIYEKFVAKVASGRGLPKEEVYKIAEGRIWSGLSAKEKRLVDVIGGLDAAIELARKAAGIPADRKVDLIEYPQMGLFNPETFMPKLIGVRTEGQKADWREAYLKLIVDNPGKPMPVMSLDLIYGN